MTYLDIKNHLPYDPELMLVVVISVPRAQVVKISQHNLSSRLMVVRCAAKSYKVHAPNNTCSHYCELFTYIAKVRLF